MSKKIMIDIDDTLYRNNIVADVLSDNGLNYNDYDIKYDINSNIMWSIDIRKEIIRRLTDITELNSLEIIQTSKECLVELYNNGYKIDIVSARPKSYKNGTIDMLAKDLDMSMINKVVCLGDESKVDYVLRRKYDVIVDDKAEFMLDSKIHHITRFIPTNEHTRHNHTLLKFWGVGNNCGYNLPNKFCPNIYPIKDLMEIPTYLNLNCWLL